MKKSIKINFIFNTILKMSSFIFPLITYPYVSRILAPEGLGKVAFATSVASYFSLFASLGIPTYGIKACAKVRDDKVNLSRTVQELLILNTITLLVTYSVFIITINNVDKMHQYKPLLIINSISMILTVFGVEWLYSALEEYVYISVRSFIFKIVSIVMLVLLVKEPSDYIMYSFITVFAAVGSNILNLINIRKYVFIQPVYDYNIRQHLKPMLLLFSVTVAINIYTNLDTTMLGFMTNDFEVGLYNTAIKFKSILVSIVLSLVTVLYPRFSYYYCQKKQLEIDKLLSKTVNIICILSFGLTGFFFINAKECILFLAGADFLGAIPSTAIITLTIPIIALASLISYQILIPTNKEKVVVIATVAGAITDLILNAILIPIYGAKGVAIATLAAEIVGLGIQAYYGKTQLRNLREVRFKYFMIPLIVAIICNLGIEKILYTDNFFINLVILGIVYFGAYGTVLLLMKEPITLSLFNTIHNKIPIKLRIGK